MSLRRVRALVLRYLWLYTRTAPRALEMFFWPVMDLLVWGLVTRYLLSAPFGVPNLIKFLIGAMIFWDILYRAQQGVTLSFLEDVWSRNLINLFVAPITLGEFTAATCIVGLIRIGATFFVLAALAQILYAFNIFMLGLSLIPFFVNLLLMGWALGMITTGLIIRYGQAAEALAWGVPFFVQPFCAVFYPVETLPAWIRPFSEAIPATHVFEGMRAVIAGKGMDWGALAGAYGLAALYLLGAAWFFGRMFRSAREKGLLAKLGTQ